MSLASVVHLTSVHSSSDGRIFHKECRTLADAGYAVTLISTSGEDDTGFGVRRRTVPPARCRLDRMTRVVLRVFGIALRETADLYHFHDPELIPVGILLKLAGKRVIYDVHEDIPLDILNKYWIPRGFRRMLASGGAIAEAIGAGAFDGIVAATPPIAARFAARKTVTVQNFPKLEEFSDRHDPPYTARPPLIVYVGRITQIRGVDEVIEAVDALPESLGARLALAGFFAPAELEGQARSLQGWKNVRFLGWQSRQGVTALLSQARVGLAILHPRPSYFQTYSTKVFEYMAAGIPVVVSDFPLWREIVDSAGCGLLVNPLQPGEIADAILWLLEHPQEAEAMGQRGLQAVRRSYSWETESRKLLALYKTILDGKRD